LGQGGWRLVPQHVRTQLTTGKEEPRLNIAPDTMKGRGGFGYAWSSIALLVLVLGCAGAPLKEASPAISGDAKKPIALTQAAPIQFTLASDGLPMEGYWKSAPAVADVNGDGFLDIAVNPRLEKGARVFLGNGKGVWRDSSRGLATRRSCGGGLQFSDVNNDGILDLVVADHCEGVYVFLGDGKGNWRAVTEGLTSEFSSSAKAKERDDEGFKGAEAVAVGDVNGDGFVDMVVSSSDQGRTGRKSKAPDCPAEIRQTREMSIWAAGRSISSCWT
jgi:FG-GAP-like repeat/FG-GAP repeat